MGDGGDGFGEGGGGVEADDGGVAAEPCELFLGVDASVFGYAGYGGGLVHLTAEVCGYLFVADCIERIEIALCECAAGFVDEAVGYHGVDAAVDAVEEFLAGSVDHHFDYLEVALGAAPGAERAVGGAGFEAYLEGVDDAPRVGTVDCRPVVGVEDAQLCEDGFEALLSEHGQDVGPGAVADGGHGVDAAHDGVDVHHGAAAHHRHGAALPQRWQQREHVFLVARRAVVLVERESAHKVMPRPLPFGGSGRGGSYGNVAE